MTQDEIDAVVKEECSVLNNVISLSAVKYERQCRSAQKGPDPDDASFTDDLSFRIERIKNSVDRINRLMMELKGIGLEK